MNALKRFWAWYWHPRPYEWFDRHYRGIVLGLLIGILGVMVAVVTINLLLPEESANGVFNGVFNLISGFLLGMIGGILSVNSREVQKRKGQANERKD